MVTEVSGAALGGDFKYGYTKYGIFDRKCHLSKTGKPSTVRGKIQQKQETTLK